MTQEEKILLYWSGEADENLTLEIEALLRSDSEAKEYFHELGELQNDLRVSQIPERSSGLFDRVLAQEAVVALPQKKVNLAKWMSLAAAASLALLAVIILNRSEQNGSDSEIVDTPQKKTLIIKKDPAPVVIKKKTPLSQRMLSRSSIFRKPGKGLDEHRKERKRWEKIRIQKHNI